MAPHRLAPSHLKALGTDQTDGACPVPVVSSSRKYKQVWLFLASKMHLSDGTC